MADQKSSLRRVMLDKRSQLALAERTAAAASASARLTALPEMRMAVANRALIAGFAAVRGELDPSAALDDARGRGAKVALPRVDPSQDSALPVTANAGASEAQPRPRLHLHLSSGAALRPGRFGICEPEPSCPEVRAVDVSVLIVPGLAFDGAGHRLGFGGGYYDELLGPDGGGRPSFVIGLAYDFQVVDVCPADERDARVDCVVTDARVIRCPDGGGGEARKAGV